MDCNGQTQCTYCGNWIDPLQLCSCPRAVADYVLRRTNLTFVADALYRAGSEIDELRAAIAELEKAEPVGYWSNDYSLPVFRINKGNGCNTPLYLHPSDDEKLREDVESKASCELPTLKLSVALSRYDEKALNDFTCELIRVTAVRCAEINAARAAEGEK